MVLGLITKKKVSRVNVFSNRVIEVPDLLASMLQKLGEHHKAVNVMAINIDAFSTRLL